MQNFIKEIKSLSVLILAILFLKETVVELYIVPTGSMEKNILRGDMLVGSRYIYGMKVPQKIWVPFTAVSIPTFLPDYRFPAFKDVERGDVVVFDPPFPYDASGKQFVKRIIAIPGDTIENSSGIILVNGKPYGNDYGPTSEISEVPKTLVPEGYYYVLGDNRNSSNDSRNFGFVPRTNIIGRVWVIYWPFSNFKIFDYNLISASNG